MAVGHSIVDETLILVLDSFWLRIATFPRPAETVVQRIIDCKFGVDTDSLSQSLDRTLASLPQNYACGGLLRAVVPFRETVARSGPNNRNRGRISESTKSLLSKDSSNCYEIVECSREDEFSDFMKSRLLLLRT
jgi:hypothetical protein